MEVRKMLWKKRDSPRGKSRGATEAENTVFSKQVKRHEGCRICSGKQPTHLLKYPDYSVHLRYVPRTCTNHAIAGTLCLSWGPTDLESSRKEKLALDSVLRENCCWKKDESRHIFGSTFSIEQAVSWREWALQLLHPLKSLCWCE